MVYPLDLLAHFRLHLALLAAAAGVGSFVLGAPRAGLAAIVAAALGVAGLGPALAPAQRAAAPGPVREVAIALANVNFFNREKPAAARALLARDADLLLTLETPVEWRRRAHGFTRRYPRVVNGGRWVTTGNWMWTDLPVLAGDMGPFSTERPSLVWARLDLGAEAALDVLGLHFRRPVFEAQETQLAGLEAAPPALGRPLVVLGDFNAAPWSAAVGRVARRFGVEPVGGLRLTWRSVKASALGPLGALLSLPIDHVLVSPGIGVRSIETFAIPGSDHRGVLVRLAVPVTPVGPAPGAGQGRSGRSG